jgi:hypothetical protein
MMTVLRWARRHIAALLLVASPAIGGQLVPLAHPCPVEAPWVTEGGAADPHAAHTHVAHTHAAPDAPTPAEQHAHGDCTCIGACATPLALDAPRSPIAVRTDLVAHEVVRRWVPIERLDAGIRPLDRLPPQTAPPLA